ncbi:hypothetical protein [Halobacillus salinus]|uniref:hypothetical protein n=1 Tax=Halobacillus salinus TaxID=192814 RepID=UPI001591A1ED|nr:hypothetical protein [Halobacillus salinus]
MGSKLFMFIFFLVAGSFIVNIFIDNESVSTIINVVGFVVLAAVAVYLRRTLGRRSER